MPLLKHLIELRRKIIISVAAILVMSVIAFIIYMPIMEVLFKPFEQIPATQLGSKLFANTIFEMFMTKLEVSILAGIILTLPVHIYSIVSFILPALIKKERRVLIISLIVSTVLVVFAFAYGYNYIIPISVKFLTSKGFFPEDVGLLLSFKRNIFYILQLLFACLLIFQIPVLLEILMIMNIVKRKALLRFSKYFIVIIFLVSAIITPPEFISQMLIAVPLTLLYFLTILIARLFRFGE